LARWSLSLDSPEPVEGSKGERGRGENDWDEGTMEKTGKTRRKKIRKLEDENSTPKTCPNTAPWVWTLEMIGTTIGKQLQGFSCGAAFCL